MGFGIKTFDCFALKCVGVFCSLFDLVCLLFTPEKYFLIRHGLLVLSTTNQLLPVCLQNTAGYVWTTCLIIPENWFDYLSESSFDSINLI